MTHVTATSLNSFYGNIDLSTDQEKKFRTTATKGLEDYNKYTGDKAEISKFLRNIEHQEEKYGFVSIGQEVISNGVTVNFFTNPGKLTLQELEAYKNTY